MEHLEKDVKRMWHHKDVLVLVISVIALVLSVIAICVSFDGGEHGGRGGEGYGRMMNGYESQQGMYYDDNNQNPNDGEYADDATSSKMMASTTRK